MNAIAKIGMVLGTCLFSGCRSVPSTEEIPAVKNFEISRYLGRWHEVARLPHSFERDMTSVTADYSMRPDGMINVVNSGWKNGKPRSVHGIARSAGAPDTGELEVSFFRPFYGKYRIIFLEPDYSFAVVTSSTRDYLWILARSPKPSAALLNRTLEQLDHLGFDTSRLEWP